MAIEFHLYKLFYLPIDNPSATIFIILIIAIIINFVATNFSSTRVNGPIIIITIILISMATRVTFKRAGRGFIIFNAVDLYLQYGVSRQWFHIDFIGLEQIDLFPPALGNDISGGFCHL